MSGRKRSSPAIRRRRFAAGALVAAVLLIVGVALSSSGSGKPGHGATGAQTAGEGKSVSALGERRTSHAQLTGSYRGAVPILMYHVIKAPKPGVAFPDLWTPAKTFEQTIAALVQAGFHGVTLAQVWSAWHGGPGLPQQPVVISFDDGYLSHFVTARPVLNRVGWPGLLNLEGKNIGKGGLTVDQVKALIDDGWEIGAHSLTHPDLTTVSAAQLEAEVAGSRKLLQRTFGVKVESFCYPAGKNNETVQAAVRSAGYDNATTVDAGIASRNSNPYALPRIRVNGRDLPADVLSRLKSGRGATGGYG